MIFNEIIQTVNKCISSHHWKLEEKTVFDRLLVVFPYGITVGATVTKIVLAAGLLSQSKKRSINNRKNPNLT